MRLDTVLGQHVAGWWRSLVAPRNLRQRGSKKCRPGGRGLEALERRELLSVVASSASTAFPQPVTPFYPAPATSAAANTMATAVSLGTLSGSQTATGSVSRADRDDYYSFTVATKGDFNLTLSGLKADADVRLILDANGNKRVDRGEVLAVSGRWGTSDERISGSLEAGTYYVDVYRYSGDTSYSLTLSTAAAKNPPTVTSPASAVLAAGGKTASLSVAATDEPGQTLSYAWASTAWPSGAAAPTLANSAASSTVVTFTSAGAYTFTVTITDTAGARITSSVSLTVGAILTGLAVTPANVTVPVNTAQQFAASGLDQFGHSMAAPADCTWTATVGTIGSTSGSLTSAAVGSGSVTVSSASAKLTASTTVTVVQSNFLGLKDADLAKLTQSLDADGSISRNDMIQILTSAGADDSVVDATELSDLKIILNSASTLKIEGYVQTLASDVVKGNTANAYYQGQRLGNLAAGSSAAQLNKLIDKWFRGKDHPNSGGYTYQLVSGTLFAGTTPSHLDEYQGYLGDCYFIASVGEIADSSPAAIRNMFIDNQDGTWTVRFYANGVADYVTVDAMLPTSGGSLIYAGRGVSGSLWIALAEKAYAQWNETGKEERDGTNTYAAIEGGWMADVDAQVLGRNAASYNLATTADQNALISAMNKNLAVTIGTVESYRSDGGLSYGLYGGHAYSIISYDSARGTFQLYNPWGEYQPQAMTWQQLKTVCSAFAVADPSGSVPISTSTVTSAIWPQDVIAPHRASSVAAADSSPVAATVAGNTADAGACAVLQEDSGTVAKPSGSEATALWSSMPGLLGSDGHTSDLRAARRTGRSAASISPNAVDELFGNLDVRGERWTVMV